MATNDYHKRQENFVNLLKQIGWLTIENFIYNFYIFETFISKFFYIGVWFTNQKIEALHMKDKINITLIIKRCIVYKMTHSLLS